MQQWSVGIHHEAAVYCYIRDVLRKHNIEFRPVSEMNQTIQDRILYMTSFPVTSIAGRGITTFAQRDVDAVIETMYDTIIKHPGQFRAEVYGDITLSFEQQRTVVRFYMLGASFSLLSPPRPLNFGNSGINDPE